MRSHDFSRDDYVCIVPKHEIILPDWTKCPVIKYLTHTHHPPHLTLTPAYNMHRPMRVCAVLLSFCLFHDEHIEHIISNLYKHAGYKNPASE